MYTQQIQCFERDLKEEFFKKAPGFETTGGHKKVGKSFGAIYRRPFVFHPGLHFPFFYFICLSWVGMSWCNANHCAVTGRICCFSRCTAGSHHFHISRGLYSHYIFQNYLAYINDSLGRDVGTLYFVYQRVSYGFSAKARSPLQPV